MATLNARVALLFFATVLLASCGRTPIGLLGFDTGDDTTVTPDVVSDTGTDVDVAPDVEDDTEITECPGPGCLELCDDGLDNDLNGLIDCADPACEERSGCTCPAEWLGSELGRFAADAYPAPTFTTLCGESSSAFGTTLAWTAPYEGSFRLFADNETSDLVYYVSDTCETEVRCDAGEMVFSAAAGDDVIIHVGIAERGAPSFFVQIDPV